MVWGAVPGRSMLLLVPSGCKEPQTARMVAEWAQNHFTMPAQFANHRPICVRVTSDAMLSSAQFTATVAQRIRQQAQVTVDVDPIDYPSDVLQNVVEAALDAGSYPILVIERFHAFATIRDGGMTSVLSGMRSLEHERKLTTLALSAIGYDAIRRELDAQQPFLNSVYGDNHDQAVMSLLSREDFVSAAQERGIAPPAANRLYSKAGGPDAVYEALLDVADSGEGQLVAQCLHRAGPAVDRFLDRFIAIPAAQRQELFVSLALGKIRPAQEAFLLQNPLHNFLCKRNESNELICSTQILARRILQGTLPQWSAYGDCLTALEEGDVRRAGMLAATLTDPNPRLTAFRELISLRSALHPETNRGLFGIDWPAVDQGLKQLGRLDPERLQPFRDWLDQIGRWAECIKRVVGFPRLRADVLARRAADPELRTALLFMIVGATRSALALSEPAGRVNALVNVPETILQTIAAGFCSIDFANSPVELVEADFDGYFSGQTAFVFPSAGQKMTLSALLTIVPAMLARQRTKGASALVDAEQIRPLHGKLIDAVRNPAAHTVVAFASRDADLLQQVCGSWLHDWIAMEGYESEEDIPGIRGTPSCEALGTLLMG
ncbi:MULTISPECIES: hypothetical protein [unclassified Mesorhizobium]|uniref:hypothetical protein n=1 Tax=unclassified Mesorhizobium TaxID=325217 RepID=UPI000FCB8F4D|nr:MULTISPECIES: hypothetical protein [unclassified Mesorhizobium]TGP24878.1 hypothetical protein EN874_007040 [Mesorhizobium sp. M1D.F.Ca.ET.231.01.1.1]TGP36201.1 hypothetical protein EN877_07040 [Mesorhizobium sp. M1D.F.Ca.ET.234.01.1.1]TGS49703.1 hypothetical protein EN827_07040 [Mesorhizobium sp. M1D.F.Ca.ET.184.01.1.1]TGS64415.1 hypothetical protein EN826_007040 [Mesorhizobium sp. M1D.F.Ca.ET.183.01.1.1]